MYSYIKGTLEYLGTDFAVVDVSGVGYKIFTATQNIKDAKVGDIVKFYTHLHVREDIMALYGFISQQELDMFELLISVSGVGPKASLALISTLSPSKFALSLVTNDSKSLSKAPGIGTKMAGRIILELKDKVKSEQLDDNNSDIEICNNDDFECEAVNALVVLGYSKYEAVKAVKSVGETNDIEITIKEALKKLARF